MTSLLNTGKTALFAFQQALATSSHNIANVNTEGYSRQRVDFKSVPGDGSGVTSTGGGVRISAIDRLSDEFASARVASATSAHAEQDVHHQLASRLDNLVSTDGMSVAPALQNFFNSIQDANADPSSLANREVVLENTNQLVDRFTTMQDQFDELQSEVNDRTTQAVREVDQIASAIADVNSRILGAANNVNSQQTHDLKDQRDQLVNRMSEYIDVDTLIQDNGSMSVFIGKGINIVTDSKSQSLTTVRDTLYPDRVQIQIGDTATPQLLAAGAQGGIIGGLSEFSLETLSEAKHGLGRLALIIADEMNNQHAVGIDLDGNPGTDIFGDTTPEVFSGTQNTGTGIVNAFISNTNALQPSEYVLRYDGANFTATRSSDGETTTSAPPMNLDGMSIILSGAPIAGDVFLVSATGRAAGSMSTLIENPEKLALSSQLTTSSDIGNLGDSSISTATIIDPDDFDLSTPVEIVFSSETSYDIINANSGATLVAGAGYIQNQPITLNGYEISLSGDPKTGDSHTVTPNTSGRGNNSNGLALAEMQLGLHVDGQESFNEAYGTLVSIIGSNTSAAETRTTALQSLRDNSVDRQQATQGVSLDEEAIDLTRFQQAYQAAAQVISTSETLFQTILGAVQ